MRCFASMLVLLFSLPVMADCVFEDWDGGVDGAGIELLAPAEVVNPPRPFPGPFYPWFTIPAGMPTVEVSQSYCHVVTGASPSGDAFWTVDGMRWRLLDVDLEREDATGDATIDIRPDFVVLEVLDGTHSRQTATFDTSGLAPGEYFIGNVLDTSAWADIEGTGTFISEWRGTYSQFNVTVVPEPSPVLYGMAVLCLVGIIQWRIRS